MKEGRGFFGLSRRRGHGLVLRVLSPPPAQASSHPLRRRAPPASSEYPHSSSPSLPLQSRPASPAEARRRRWVGAPRSPPSPDARHGHILLLPSAPTPPGTSRRLQQLLQPSPAATATVAAVAASGSRRRLPQRHLPPPLPPPMPVGAAAASLSSLRHSPDNRHLASSGLFTPAFRSK
ncbi:pectinesterase inhibitor 10-like [Zingiber officinale]|uniref:pectinesterase inhibitor 10-like n=1 Tax=Zingiber officinale TaxID=94328 RepID=UPI001C4CF9CA|nr:pectinesterase inhibitor 10-like [Zingiber officinale]